MDEEINVFRNSISFFANTLGVAGIDSHIVLIGADSICLPPPVGSGSCPADENLPAYRHVVNAVGSTNALSETLSTYPQWMGSLRAGATKTIVVLSDDENTDITAATFNTDLLALDPTLAGYKFHAMTSTGLCGGASEYTALATETNGLVFDLCSGANIISPALTEIATAILEDLASDVVMNLPGSGVSLNLDNNSSSGLLHPDTAQTIATADVDGNGGDDVVVSFSAGAGPTGAGGTWISRNKGPLVLLDSKVAEGIAVGDFDGNGQDDLLLDFGADGLWLGLDDIPPFLLIDLPLGAMAAGDVDNNGQDDMVLSFAGIGTFSLNNLTTVNFLDSTVANDLELGDIDGNGEDEIYASFSAGEGPGGVGGLFVSVNQGALFSVIPLETLNMTSGDFDGSGQDDFLFDFGGATGLLLLLNGASAISLGSLPVVAMASGDVDINGLDDMILSITGIGTIAFKNLTTIDILDSEVAVDLATGTNLAAPPVAAVGSLIISEMMINPEVAIDSDGEWIEVFNATGPVTDINGWTLTDESGNTHVINNGGPLLISPGGFLVLGVNADSAANGGVILDYQYSDITLNNGGDIISLISPGPSGEVVDSVSYTSSVSGSSTSLDPSAFDHVLNDNLSNWCPSTTVFGDGDLGTPGAVNGSCSQF